MLDRFADGPGHVRRLLRAADAPIVFGVAAGIVATLLGTAVLVTAFLWPSTAPPAASAPPLAAAGSTEDGGQSGGTAQPVPSVPTTSAPPSASTRPSPTPTGARTAAPVALTARFAKAAGAGLAGYPATVTVANPGTAPVTGWTVILTLPRDTLTVTDVAGATVTRDGAVWTFVPDASTAEVGASRSVTVSFRINGAALLDATPTACTIDGRPCQSVG